MTSICKVDVVIYDPINLKSCYKLL